MLRNVFKSEVVGTCTHGKHQVIIGQYPRRCLHGLCIRVYPNQLAHMKTDIRLFLKQPAERVGYVGGFDECSRHLVNQRRKEMIVVSIDQRDGKTAVLSQMLYKIDSGKASTDDDDMFGVIFHISTPITSKTFLLCSSMGMGSHPGFQKKRYRSS